MKIVILTDNIISGGGAGVIAWNHAKALKSLGHEVAVITTSQDLVAEEKIQKEGITIYTLFTKYHPVLRAYKSLNNPLIVKRVGEILSEIKPEIVHAHNIHSYLSYASLAVAKKHTQKIFITIHDSMPFHYSKLFPSSIAMEGSNVKSYKISPLTQLKNFKWQYNPFRNLIIKKYLKIPTKLFAVSGALAQALVDNGIGNVEVLHNGIDVAEWEDNTFKKETNKKFVFFGGRLSRAKGGDVLIVAMNEIFKKRKDIGLFLVGEKNSYTDELEGKLVDKSYFTLWGLRPHRDMKLVYYSADLVVAPSLCFDWFPTVILEAMACKKPVVATCFGGSKEMVVDGKTGYVVDPRNVDMLTEKILDLLDNPARAEEFANAGYERVKSEFSIAKHISTLLEWYNK